MFDAVCVHFYSLCSTCDILSSRCRCCSFMGLWSRSFWEVQYIADGQITACVTKKGHVADCASTSDCNL